MKMNTPIEIDGAQRCSMSAQFRSLLEPPRLLPGECQSNYEAVRQMTIDEVAPQTSIEWLWTIDVFPFAVAYVIRSATRPRGFH
jgi:hypothetical protein